MRMETYIRKSLRMKAHWVTEVVETEEGWVARVDRLGNRRLRCGHCRGETKVTRGRRPRDVGGISRSVIKHSGLFTLPFGSSALDVD